MNNELDMEEDNNSSENSVTGGNNSTQDEKIKKVVVSELIALFEDKKFLQSILSDEAIINVVQRSEFHSGPLPAPRTLKEYDEICPGSAERIISEWQKDTSARRANQKKIVDKTFFLRKIGQFNAGIFANVCIAGSVLLAYFGAYSAAGIVGGVTVASVVGAFLYERVYLPNQTEPQEDRSDEKE